MLKWLAVAVCAGVWHAAWAAEDPFAFEESMQEGAMSAWQPLFELQLRQDAVRNLPRPLEADFDRWEARTRFGTDWHADERLSVRATARAFLAEQENELMAFNLDNERLRDVAVDELYLDMQAGATGSIFIGQGALPLALSSMLWDQDLRWRGLRVQGVADSVQHEHRISLARGRIDHAFGGAARLSGLQWQWRLNRAAGAAEVLLAGLAFDDVDTLPEAFRTNSRAGTGLATAFRVADLQFMQTIGHGANALRVAVDVARNFEAQVEGDAARLDLRYGDAVAFGGFEIGAAVQRVQADAVPAAFNDDDWWFPSRMRGHVAWLGFGFTGGWTARLAAFREKRDGMDEYMQRALLDVSWRF